MFTPRCKANIKQVLIVAAAGFCMLSNGVRGQDQAYTLPTGEAGGALPPVEQVLVPEGVFAVQLTEALKLGTVHDQAKAEALLSDLGIEPEHGWIEEYPVTPAVLGELEKDVAAAVDNRKLGVSKEQALRAVAKLKSNLGFTVKSETDAPAARPEKHGKATLFKYTDAKGVTHFTDTYDSIPENDRKEVKKITPPKLTAQRAGNAPIPGADQLANPNPENIARYYDQEGPPAVTYYAPPEAYNYLYRWVSYPFWSTGYYFPGYFVLNNFRRQIYYRRHPYTISHHDDDHRFEQPPPPAALPWSTHDRDNRTAPTRWYDNAPAQAGAQAIQNRQRDRRQLFDEDSSVGTTVPPFAQDERTPIRNNPAMFRHRNNESYQENASPMPNENRRTWGRVQEQQNYQWQNQHNNAEPAFAPERSFNSPQPFARQNAGESQHGGSFEGGGFSGHGGGMRGGRR